MESQEEQVWWKTSPFPAIGIGIILIIAASVVKLATDWITIPLQVSSVKELFDAIVYSFGYVLNFEFKLWWVFLLIIYIMVRWKK